jgi:PqqD family protein of HPr-rel-A system
VENFDPSSPTWHLAPHDSLIVEPLDSLTAVFDRRSGQTHILASPMPELIDALAHGPADLAELTGRLTETFDLSADDAIADSLAARLSELAALGLIEAR